ncbi:hypothetical protein EDM53_03120 [Rickettsiales endosymbiont of Peranema trichophorum]|uniref:hypothetical protein n=1 Tax=Rickettsiales endosymbiont of Peranema trichophorum TaxID=2486577 RepID=UPI001023CA20|nr:hypothetical protein [Rickettsiales endosymbiont of Peranema trichophorum]RZI47207.1 hypothetical protein EDM53_03120 [Rickettsiales endosymbiont of Peranema trichophorum]
MSNSVENGGRTAPSLDHGFLHGDGVHDCVKEIMPLHRCAFPSIGMAGTIAALEIPGVLVGQLAPPPTPLGIVPTIPIGITHGGH